jgi:segregation and condensation protein B
LLETVVDQSDEPESAALAASSSEDEADAEAMTPDDGEASTPNEPEFTRAGLAMDESSFPAAGEEPTPTIEPLVEVSLEETSALPAMSSDEIKANLEALLYAAGEPLTFRELKKVLRGVAPDLIKEGLGNLKDFYGAEGRGLQIVEVAGGFQITTRPEYHDRISRLFKVKPPARLSVQALETLAAIAYRQPITVPEILELRGVNSAGVVRTLLEKKLVRIMGRKPVVGRPILYGTSKEFLLRFGLKDLHELPRLEDMSEIFGDEVALPIDAAPDPSPSAAEVATDGVAEDDVPSPSAEDPEEFLAEKKGDGEIERG